MGIEFPGGPQIEILAKKVIQIGIIYLNRYLTKVGVIFLLLVLNFDLKNFKINETEQDKFDLAASFPKNYKEILYKKTAVHLVN